MPEGIPVLAWVNTPIVVPPSARQLLVGAAAVPQQVPRAVMAALPALVTFAPRVAPEAVIAVAVGVVTVGGVAPVVNVPSAE